MKIRSMFFMALTAMMTGVSLVSAQNQVTIKGKVQFFEPNFKMKVYVPATKKVLAETIVNDDHTYTLQVPVAQAQEAIVDCGRWQSVNVWLEDENLDIDFRGMDTARIKIKNPPYVYIRGGKKNEVMNWVNFESYRNYQSMIAISQSLYRAQLPDTVKQKLAMNLYDKDGENYTAHMKYIAEHYADRSSVLAVLKRMNYEENEVLISQTLNRLLASQPKMKETIEAYRREEIKKKEMRMLTQPGQPAPNFQFTTEKGKTVDLSQFKGKVVVLDFWASWCGPCRKEIPHLKAYYEQFKDKDVAFVSVSIDAKKADWTKALGEEQMPWNQGWVKDAGKEVMDLYQFRGIPFIMVLDKEGCIYKKNLRGEGVQKAVEEALSGAKASGKKQKSIAVGMMSM